VRNEAGALADPTDLMFAIKEPGDLVTEYVYGVNVALVKDSTGIYHVYWDCVEPGYHFWRYEATGTITAAEESSFYVRTSRVRPPVERVVPVSAVLVLTGRVPTVTAS